jgi:hypothetical protein
VAGNDWFGAEFDGTGTLFGFVILNEDLRNSEWGYFSLAELMNIRVCGWMEVDCELESHWKIRPARLHLGALMTVVVQYFFHNIIHIFHIVIKLIGLLAPSVV